MALGLTLPGPAKTYKPKKMKTAHKARKIKPRKVNRPATKHTAQHAALTPRQGSIRA